MSSNIDSTRRLYEINEENYTKLLLLKDKCKNKIARCYRKTILSLFNHDNDLSVMQQPLQRSISRPVLTVDRIPETQCRIPGRQTKDSGVKNRHIHSLLLNVQPHRFNCQEDHNSKKILILDPFLSSFFHLLQELSMRRIMTYLLPHGKVGRTNNKLCGMIIAYKKICI